MSTNIDQLREQNKVAKLVNETAQLEVETALLTSQAFPGMTVDIP